MEYDKATTNIKEAVTDYLQIRKQVDRRDIWIGQLIAAQAAASGTTRKSRRKKIRMTKAIRKKARDVKCALGQLDRCRGLLQVTAPIKGSSTNRKMYITKEQIELACLEEAHRRFTQAMDMPMLQQTMTLGIGLKDINLPAFQEILDSTFKCPLHCKPMT